jgi:peroxiredoxin
MNAYRDQYAQLFNDGKGVTVIGISADADTTQANWAREANYPVTMASDTAKNVGRAYSALPNPAGLFRRDVFVVGKDGRVTHVMRRFNQLAQTAYDSLGAAVRAALQKEQ